KDQLVHSKNMLVACSIVSHPLFSKYGIYWSICISQDAKEVFLPLQMLFLQLTLLSAFLVIIIIFTSYVFASMFVKPIQTLHEATEKIAEGDLDYPIHIRTEDEIEQLADSFKYMISVLKEKQDSLQELTNNLEAKVKERTSELTRSQEATLNILEDLTEAKRKIEESMRIKTEFTSMVSHELRTPLTAIKEGIGIVLDGSAGQINIDQKDFLETAKRNVDRLARLINDVLDFQKLESGRMPFNFQEGDLNAVIKESCVSMKPQADSKNIRFEINLAENLPRMNFDKDKIAQVMVNLINNAIKFTIAGGIRVSTILGNNTVKVAVEDTGPGIKKEDMPKLFQRFQQLGEYHERRVASSGLGLAISKEIIEMHKGKIWVESEYGKGSTFYFVLPIKERRE
ncbi:MAG TPA: ATP-binding protein, partial [Candidatus Omnitrophota bacterium]|nr:ATP-binding protein [Candidatus Omnitrophota bacterium]